MKKGLKKLLKFNQKTADREEKKISLETLLFKIFKSYNLEVEIEEVQGYSLESGYGFHTYSNRCGSIFTCIGESSPGKLPPIERLFYLYWNEDQYMLNNNFRMDFAFKESNLRDLEFMADERKIYSIRFNSGKIIYFLLDNSVCREVVKLINNSDIYKKAVSELILGSRESHNETDEVVLDVSSRGDFMIGRLFLPSIIARKPVLTETLFTKITVSNREDQLEDWEGLCYKITFQVEGQSFSLFYLFDLINRDNIEQYKKLFYNLLKIIVKNSRQKLTECDIQIEKVNAGVVNRPEVPQMVGALRLKYYLKSANTLVSSSIFVPIEYISYLLKNITPPWYIDFTMDTLENRVKSLLSLNRELFSQGKLSIVEFFNSYEQKSSNPITQAKLSFIKVHEVLDLISESERKKIIFDYLYRKGWSAKKMKKLFYYTVTPKFEDGPQVVYPLALFNEDEFRNSLMNNMRDEWEHNHSLVFYDEEKVLLDHFNLLREMYMDETLSCSKRLKSILDQCFDRYNRLVDEIFEKIKADRLRSRDRDRNLQRVAGYFSDNFYIKKIFYYVPQNLNSYSEVLQPGQLQLLEKIEVEEPNYRDDWCEDYINFVLQ